MQDLAAPEWNDRDAKARSPWDLTGSNRFTNNLRVRGGVLNLLDTAAPFTNPSRHFQVTWDPTCGDPPGRAFFVNVQYAFEQPAAAASPDTAPARQLFALRSRVLWCLSRPAP